MTASSLFDDGYFESLSREFEATRQREIAVETPNRFFPGGTYILSAPATPTAVWGAGQDVVWAQGEALMLCGPSGVGKTTIANQLLRARIGLSNSVLDLPVLPAEGRVLYFAMDRPNQWRRAAARVFTPDEQDYVNERMTVWAGPPPFDFARNVDTLTVLAAQAKADTVFIDSVKDAAVGISDDVVGAGYNRCRQKALAEGIEVIELHHQRKSGVNGSEPRELVDVYGSVWLTAGAGSVVGLWGDPGDPVISWRHLKQPMAEVGPYLVVHNHQTGQSSLQHSADLMELVRAGGFHGLTAQDYAKALFEEKRPTRAQVEKARRRLEQKTAEGLLHRRDGAHKTESARYFLSGESFTKCFTQDQID